MKYMIPCRICVQILLFSFLQLFFVFTNKYFFIIFHTSKTYLDLQIFKFCYYLDLSLNLSKLNAHSRTRNRIVHFFHNCQIWWSTGGYLGACLWRAGVYSSCPFRPKHEWAEGSYSPLDQSSRLSFL
jgi:hypothetical protein